LHVPCFFSIAALLGVLAGCQTTTALTWQLPQGVKTTEINGYPMAYAEQGSGPTVVLVHGAMCDYRCWSPSMPALSKNYRVVSVSLRHHYPETWNGSGETYSLAQHAKDLSALVETLSPPVRIVGHSYGATVAFEMARLHPELVSQLVLAEGGGDGLLPPPTAQWLEGRRKFAVATEDMLKTKGADATMEFGVDLLYGKGTWSRYPAALQAVQRGNAWTMVAGARAPLPSYGTCADFGALKMPVLLATGENTTPRHKRLIAEQRRCLPSARTMVVPKVGHGMISDPAFIGAVHDFLK
jgi:pimeloyl-ACP methyl ester carboxylesterase